MINLFKQWAVLSCLVAACVYSVGCQPPAADTPPPAEAPVENADGDHGHDHDGETPVEGETSSDTESADAPGEGGSAINFGDL